VISVALPVLNGGPLLDEVLAAVRTQRVDDQVELVVVDSGSTDGSVDLARRHGATVIAIDRSEFSHGGTRDLLMRSTRGDRVAFLTQDAVPAHDGWLTALVRGFDRAGDVALVYGPYVPRPDAPHWVRRELTEFFGSEPRVDRGAHRFGDATFYSDANGCILRSVYERVPFRHVSYAEDQLLAADMLAAGYAKAYEPDAAVVHSHDYPPAELFGRLFDEFRALREVHGHVEQLGARYTLGTLRRQVARDRAFLRAEGAAGAALERGTVESLRFYAIRAAASTLGSRADRLPAALRGALSRDGRASFDPVDGR
jgi:rhamnosyltransferase